MPPCLQPRSPEIPNETLVNAKVNSNVLAGKKLTMKLLAPCSALSKITVKIDHLPKLREGKVPWRHGDWGSTLAQTLIARLMNL